MGVREAAWWMAAPWLHCMPYWFSFFITPATQLAPPALPILRALQSGVEEEDSEVSQCVDVQGVEVEALQ